MVLNRTIQARLYMQFWDRHKAIMRYYELLTDEVCNKFGLTQMEYDILMFLFNNPQYNTAADIVKVRKSAKSHVSTSLKCLEKKGLIVRKQNKENKKTVEIFLLDTANAVVKEGLCIQRRFRQNLFRGFSEDEIILCKTMFEKICSNAEGCISTKRNGDEPSV